MDSPHPMYNQAGPSNFAHAYVHDTRPTPQYGSGRGRGHSGPRNTNPSGMYHQTQQQPFYAPNAPSLFSGYPMGMNGINGASVNGHYLHGQNGIPPARRAGPSFQAAHYQAPASPALPPTHVYSPHVPSYIPPAPPPTSSPTYHYPNGPTHMQPFPASFTPPLHPPSYPYVNHQSIKSPLMSPLPEQVTGSPRFRKVHMSSPQSLQLSSVPLLPPPQHTQSHLPPQIPITDIPSDAGRSPRLVTQQPTSPPSLKVPQLPTPEMASEVVPEVLSDIQPSSPIRTPASTIIDLPSLNNEPPPQQEWVISANRPDDPVNAFGIMISPKAKPPAHIVEGALAYRSPLKPTIPLPISTREIPKVFVPSASDIQVDDTEEKEELESDWVPSHAEQVSGSATETESRASTATDVFVPGYHPSTAISVSLAPPNVDSNVENESQELSVSAPTSQSPSIQSPKSIVTKIVTGNLPSPVPARPSTSSSSVKRSWASLLQSNGSSTSKTSLPTSSVLGFSVPAAETDASLSSSAVSPAKRNDVLHLLTSGPSAGGGVPQIRPRGLVNTGNMCFANAVLQTLVYTPPFFRLFTELGKYISGKGAGTTKWDGKATPLVDATIEFLKEFKPKGKSNPKDDEDYDGIDSFIPTYVYDAMKEKSRFDNMGGGQQEDAEEFFGFFLDTVEEELLSITNSLTANTRLKPQVEEHSSVEEDGWLEVGKKNKAVTTRTIKSVNSPMTRIFGGKFRSTLKVPGQRDSVMVEDWRSLQLDIQREQVNSIEDAFRYISHPQPVQVSSVIKGGVVVDATQQVLVDALPPILVLHLKRFLYDTSAKDVVKVHKQIAFGPELEVPSDAIWPARRTVHPVRYKLFAALFHHGQSAAGGHYTLDVLHPNRNADRHARPREGWIRIDDEVVSDLRQQDVFGGERDCAYLLFYRRIDG